MRRRFTLFAAVLSLLLGTVSAALSQTTLADGPNLGKAGSSSIPTPPESIGYTDASTIHLKTSFVTPSDQNTPIQFTFDDDFVDGRVWDGNNTYELTLNGCKSTIKMDSSAFAGTHATVTLTAPDPNNNNACNTVSYKATIDNLDAGRTMFGWASPTQIAALHDNYSLTFQVNSSTKLVGNTNHDLIGNTCHNDVLFGSPCNATCVVDLTLHSDKMTGDTTATCTAHAHGFFSNTRTVTIHNVEVNGSPDQPDPNVTSNGGNSTSTAAPSLQCHAGINPLNWLICAAIYGLAGIINGVDGVINNQLEVNSSSIFGDGGSPNSGTSANYYQAWSTFRDIALGLMVIAGLIVIISQALGFEFLDAYTLRKVLPRLIIVAIGIALSWPLMSFFVNFTNDLGHGIRSLVYAPFFSGPHALSNTVNLDLGTGQGWGVSLATSTAVANLGVFGLLSFVLTGALAVFVAFLVLIIRQIIIVLLVILAPIAIVAYILPNTQKVYQIWWDSFAKALLMFPIIEGFIAAGRVFSAIAAQRTGNVLDQLIAFAAYFAPYFLIPLTFRFAGGALAGIGGFVNDRHRGAFDGLRRFRAETSKRRRANALHRAQTGKIFKNAPANSVRNRLNAGIMGATLAGEAGFNPARWRSRIGAGMLRVAEQQRDAMLEDKDFVTKQDDDWNRAASEARSESEFRSLLERRNPTRYGGTNGRQNLARDVARYRTMNQKYGTGALRQAAWLQAMAGGTAFATGAEAWQAAQAVAGGDDATLATLVGKGRSAAMSAGRADIGGAGFGDTMAIARNFRDTPGYSLRTAQKRLAGHVLDAQGAGVLAHASMKKSSVENLVPELQDRLSTARAQWQTTGDSRAYERELATVANLYDAMAQSSPQNAQILADNVLNWSAPGIAGQRVYGPQVHALASTTVQQDMEAARSSETFQLTRRELTARQAQAGQIGGGATGNNPPPVNPNLGP